MVLMHEDLVQYTFLIKFYITLNFYYRNKNKLIIEELDEICFLILIKLIQNKIYLYYMIPKYIKA